MSIEKLESMKGSELIAYADKLGVKVNCNKERTGLKESKAKAIDKIVAFEKEHPTKKETSKKENIKHTFILPDCFISNSKYYDSVNCYKIKKIKRLWLKFIHKESQYVFMSEKKLTQQDIM